MLLDFKDEDFDNKIKNEDVSVIQFSAAWCGPCKALKPVMDKLADEYKDKAGFYYADIEDGGINTGSAAGIRGVPTVIVYKKGVEVDRKVGGVYTTNFSINLYPFFVDDNGWNSSDTRCTSCVDTAIFNISIIKTSFIFVFVSKFIHHRF